MCNACGFLCCASDCFGQCGCDHCPNSECWNIEEDSFFDDDDYGLEDYARPADAEGAE